MDFQEAVKQDTKIINWLMDEQNNQINSARTTLYYFMQQDHSAVCLLNNIRIAAISATGLSPSFPKFDSPGSSP